MINSSLQLEIYCVRTPREIARVVHPDTERMLSFGKSGMRLNCVYPVN